MKSGKIYIIGIGPGGREHITPAALRAVEESDVIVGYTLYLDLIRDLINNKEVLSTGMTKELERCGMLMDFAVKGKTASMICSGDPGIYAMAGPVLEVLKGNSVEYIFSGDSGAGALKGSAIEVEIIPGVPALAACASRIGAPLMHDFASISLSDRLTPMSVIEKRLHAAAGADFVIVIYNPRSRGRAEHLKKAVNIILEYRPGKTPVGIVKGATRPDEKVLITSLGDVPFTLVDMQSTVIVGNSNTFTWGNTIITPRGYERKYDFTSVGPDEDPKK